MQRTPRANVPSHAAQWRWDAARRAEPSPRFTDSSRDRRCTCRRHANNLGRGNKSDQPSTRVVAPRGTKTPPA